MEAFLTLNLDQQYIEELNYCRLYLQVITIVDICTPDGKCITEWAYRGIRKVWSAYNWPIQQRPSEQQWTWWQRHIRKLFLTHSRTLQQPLGSKLPVFWHQRISTAYYPTTDTLYVLNGNGYDQYKRSHQSNIYHLSFNITQQIHLPPTAQMITKFPTPKSPNEYRIKLHQHIHQPIPRPKLRLLTFTRSYTTFRSNTSIHYLPFLPLSLTEEQQQTLQQSYQNEELLGTMHTTITGEKGR